MTSPPISVAVISTGVANVASVCAALERAGTRPVCTTDPDVVRSSVLAVLPGVGSFEAGMRALRMHALDRAVRERVESGHPLLAICLGMQLLCEASEESPGIRGLGLIPAAVTRFRSKTLIRVPQLGWNEVVPEPRCALLRPGAAYFANSYRLERAPAASTGWRAAEASYAGAFVAALEWGGSDNTRGDVLACQFHPELSGAWGAALIRRWVERTCGERS